MPAEVTREPLGIACTFSDGTSARFALGGLPCQELAEDLLTGLAELVHPHGTVDAAGSVEHYVASVRHMARQLDAAGFSGDASGLRRAQAARYWMAAPGPREACTRRMLQGFQAAGGTLDAGVAELAAGRAFNPQRNRRQLPPYSETEWARLASACESAAGESFAAHKQALAAAGRGRHPREHGWSGDNLRWLLARTGPVGIVAFGEHLGCSDNVVRQRGGVLEASRDLFPGLDTVIAYRLLFGIYSGIVPDGIDDLTTGDIDWAGDSVILLSYVKGRTAAESLNLPRQAVRLLEQWLSHSALLRSHATPECRGDLWLRLNKPGGTRIWDRGGAAGRVAVQRWIERHGVTGDDGGPLKVHRSRIRTTHQSMRDKRAWAGRGRATIDPNHSPEVEGDHYLTATTPSQRQAAEAIVEDAQHDLLRRALPPTVVSAEDAASLARGYPELVASLGLDGTVIAELVGGERDVFTAACANQLSGLHGPAGKPCPARPWVCLLCPLAVFAPRHAPNLLRPVSGSVLQPLLAAALYLTGTIGPHAPGLLEQVRDADRKWSVKHGDHVLAGALPAEQITRALEGYEQRGEPLPLAGEHVIRNRLEVGWPPDDPLTRLSLGLIARQAGFTQFWRQWIPDMRSRIEEALDIVGAEKPFGRGSAAVDRADGEGAVPWTLPLDRLEAVALVGIVRTASIALLAAVSGMRSSELMELETGCCRPPEHYGDGLVRYRLASKVVKGQPLGGTPDEWVVIEPAYQAARLLVRLHDDPRPGNPLLGRFAFDVRWTWFRNWVNGPSGQRLGLAPVPDDPVSLRALRRTLAIELAYRPGGVLAAKLHLKHIAVATTEGYASRPGGAQAELLAEVNKHESERNLALVWAELRNYQQGIMPAGPGARELTEFFAHVDGKITDSAPGTPKAQASDRDVLNLMIKRAQVLHLGIANYCWFTDPSRALCLRLAGTPDADKPLVGMCDSARCPQATHHPCHRPVWAGHAENTKTFIGQLGRAQKSERKRLEAEYDRAVRVLKRIDEAAAEGAAG